MAFASRPFCRHLEVVKVASAPDFERSLFGSWIAAVERTTSRLVLWKPFEYSIRGLSRLVALCVEVNSKRYC